MQFRSPNGQDLHISTIYGHSAIVGAEWRELPEIMHLAALSAGCECDQQRVHAAPVLPESAPYAMARVVDHDSVYREALKTMIQRDEEGDFTKTDHLPNINVVSKLCGMTANKTDVLRVYREMLAEAEA